MNWMGLLPVNFTPPLRYTIWLSVGSVMTILESVPGRTFMMISPGVSTWLNGGIPPAQVAEWAGHSVAILLKIYAKCLDGQDAIAKRRIEEALGDPGKEGTTA
jgi:hypothetical protein